MSLQSTVVVGRVHTMDPALPAAEAIAFAEGRIRAIGPKAHVLAQAPGAEVIDLGDAAVLPGFIDAHHHVSLSALYGGAPRLEPPSVHDVPSLQASLTALDRDLPSDRWLIAMHWDEAKLRERRPPTRQELDAAVPDRPVFLMHYTFHRALANTKALRLAGIDRRTPEPAGGVISRGAGGLPDGLLIERAMAKVEELARADRIRVDGPGVLTRLAAHYRGIAQAGITRVCDPAVPMDLFALYRALAERGEVIVPTIACPVSLRGWLPEPTDALEGPPTNEEIGPNLKIGPVKLVFDGAPGCSMCLSWGQTLVTLARSVGIALRRGGIDSLRTSMSTAPRVGRDVRTGVTIYQPEDAARVVAAAVSRGFSVASHAIGNAAIDVALGAYAAAGARLADAGVPRLEHASFAEPSQARRMADLGVAAVVQPAMLRMLAIANAPRIPGLPFLPLRRLLDAGVKIVGSSDYPIETFEPLAALRAAVTRETAFGDVVDPDERITLDEAIAMYTRVAAEVLACSHETGTLTVGKRADLVVIDDLGDAAASVRRSFINGVAV